MRKSGSVLVVGGYPASRAAFGRLLVAAECFDTVTTADGAEAADAAGREAPPDVVLVLWPGAGEPAQVLAEIGARLCAPAVHFGASRNQREMLQSAAPHAALSHVPRHSPHGELVEALRRACTSEDGRAGHCGDRPGALTAREREVLAALARGATYDDIAGSLYISPHTVKHHLSGALRKLGARNSVQGVATAMRLGLLG